jgi:sterol 24-C-methyltransferase
MFKIGYRLEQAYTSFFELYTIPISELDEFIGAFDIFERTTNDFYVDCKDDEEQVKKYYRVLNRLCSLGSVEKMYIPPIIDPKVGVFENQILFEQGFAEELDVGPGKEVLEIGCGRGRISHHVASHTGAKVTGINIDPSQIAVAREYANKTGLLGKQLDFKEANMNSPLPFPDKHFDAFYQVQAMTYAKDLNAVFSEVARVLKPGAKLAILDGVMLDGYNESDPYHRQLLNETRQVTGFGGLWHYDDWKAAVEDSGFRVIFHADKSLGGHQYPLIWKEVLMFEVISRIISFFCWIGALPEHLAILMERFNRHKYSFIEMDKKSMLTTSWHIIAQKL